MTIRDGLFSAVDAAGVRVFGDSVTISLAGIGDETGDAVWEAPGERVDIIEGMAIASSRPRVGIHLADWSRQPAIGDQVTVRGQTYDVGEVLPDGQGGVDVELVLP